MLKAGMSLPVPWQDKPTMKGRDFWYMEAFGELSTCRAIGMDVGPIPWSSIILYVDRQRIETEWEFNTVIRSMDTEYLRFIKEQREKK